MNFWDWVVHFSSNVEHFVLDLTESLWIYPGVYVTSMVDGIFPVVPSESVVIATATAWKQTGVPWLPLIWLVAAAGAWTGDQLAYLVGTRIRLRNLRMFQGRRGTKTLDWSEHALEHRGTSFIIAARFIPMGRVAVNLSAGALRYPHRRFMGVDAVAAAIWATYSIALGIFAGSIFNNNLTLSIAVGIVGGMILGWLVDKVLARFGVGEPDLPHLAGIDPASPEGTTAHPMVDDA